MYNYFEQSKEAINKMAPTRHATLNLFICIALSLIMPIVNDAAKLPEDARSLNDDSGIRLTREYNLRQGALRGMIVKPSKNFLQQVEVFLGIPYAAPPVGGLRFIPPVYTCGLWVSYTRRAYSALRVQYNNGFRAMLRRPRWCSASAMFAEARTQDFFAVMRSRCASLLSRHRRSTNTLLKTLAERWDSPMLRTWMGYHTLCNKNAPIWPEVKRATRFAPVCPQSIPPLKKGNPPSLGRQEYMKRLRPFLENESEDCLYLNIFVPYREQKPKKFPVLVFIHGDSFEWSSGNPYDGSILASYGNIMVVTVNYRLGVLGFMNPSLTDHDFANNGLLDQLAALTWIKENIEDLNGDPNSVTLMGHGTGAACVSLLMLSPISKNHFHRAILMSGSALSDWAMTKDPTQYTLQVAQALRCNLSSEQLMQCLQSKPLSQIKKVQILAREFETRLGPIVAGLFIPTEPVKMMMSYYDLLSKYQLLTGVTELESYHDFGVLELNHGILDIQRDDFITKYAKKILEGAEHNVLKEALKQYAPTKLDPQRWSVEMNRDVILDLFSDVRTLTPMISFAKYHANGNRQSYFYVFGHNSVSSQFDQVDKSVNGEELSYVFGVPLGGANTHLHTKFTAEETLLSEVVMRLWTNFVKMGTPNTQSVNEYFTTNNKKLWHQYNVEWPEYDVSHQSYLRFDLPPSVGSYYRSNYTDFWSELPTRMKKFLVDTSYEYTPVRHTTTTTHRPKTTRKSSFDTIRQMWSNTRVVDSPSRYNSPSFGRVNSYSSPVHYKPDTDIYRQIQSIKTPSRPPPRLMDITTERMTEKPKTLPVKTSSATFTLIITLGTLFVGANIAICSILYLKKQKKKSREQNSKSRQSRAEKGEVDVIGQKSAKDDKNAIKTLKNGCSVIKTMSVNKINGNKKKKKNSEVCKTPKSDDSGGFRHRFELRRHLSTSTLDAHTKVKDWIANEVMHRCSPNVLRKSNSDLNNDTKLSEVKPFTRSEELLSDTKKIKKNTVNVEDDSKSKTLLSKTSNLTKTSEKTTSTSALGSHSSLSSTKQSFNSTKQTEKSNDSLRSKGTESVKSKKVSVAIDATPSARTNSILNQEPIEISKSFNCTDNKIQSIDFKNINQSKTESEKLDVIKIKPDNNASDRKTFTNEVTLSLDRNKSLKISHKHSASDPVTDINYDILKEQIESAAQLEIPPPLTFRNEINVTSRGETSEMQPLSAAEALLTIQRRNFPKVLPDLPKAQKRLSLQPTSLQTFRSYIGSVESQYDRAKVPPAPPPRTTTLERRLAYKNAKPMSSFDASSNNKCTGDVLGKNYENIDTLSPLPVTGNRSFDNLRPDPIIIIPADDSHRDYPKVIIPSSPQSKIFFQPSSSHAEMPSNIARVRLPEDFHSHSSSVTSFSSFCSDDDNYDIDDEFDEDTLIKELVGGVESPTDLDVLDSKGPDTIFEKKLEIVPVKLNPGQIVPKSKEDYVCVSNLYLPDLSSSEQTAQIKSNFSLNKLQHRSESINSPPEKAVKIKPKKAIKPTILNKSSRNIRRSSSKNNADVKLEHSNSASSNDTETSTGTVKEVKKR